MRDYLAVLAIGVLFFVPFLGEVHLFDWDEINFAECAREMLLTGDYFRPQIDFQPFWEKPPLFIWMQVLSMKIFGVTEFAARFPNAVCGILTLLLIFHIGHTLFSRRLAWLWVMVWLASFLPHFYFKSGIIDPWFNLFIFSGLWLFFLGKCHDRSDCVSWRTRKYILFGGFSVGLAILTKGPVALLVAGLVIGAWWVAIRMRDKVLPLQFIGFVLVACLLPGLWFATDIMLHGTWFTKTFTAYQIRLFFEHDAGHKGFFGYHFVVFLLGCFVASAYAAPWLFRLIPALRNGHLSDRKSVFTLWMWLLFWVVMLLFSLVQTKIVHYSSLIYFPTTFFAAHAMWSAEKWNIVPKFTRNALALIGLTIGALLLALPSLTQTNFLMKLFERDAFALANLQADVHWDWYHGLPGVFLCTGIIATLILLSRKQIKLANDVILAAGMLTVTAAIYTLPNNIEAYSQNAAIEFCTSKAQEDCLIGTYKFKSYAHLFYGKKRPQNTKDIDLMNGKQDKAVYIISKVQHAHELVARADFKQIGVKYGFVFFEKR
jgi:4-amino-4-deoxy-L-arabinose transferase-like glycosyltransferase